MVNTYTQRQIMVSLAFIAYTDQTNLPQPSPTQLAVDVQAALAAAEALNGDWELVWGPVSYTVPGARYPDNMMYAVKLNGSLDPAQYAIAIRGTNGIVVLDWLLEDFDIGQLIPWSTYASPTAPGNISESASISLRVLLGMADGTGQTLLSFLSDEMGAQAAGAATICVTGHSLGGTLATVLALYLRENEQAWNTSGNGLVTTVHFAAPTAGDSGFAARFNTQFEIPSNTTPPSFWIDPAVPVTHTSFADCVRNSLDVAPRVWNIADIATIHGIYLHHLFDDIHEPLVGDIVFDLVSKYLAKQDYTQPQADQAPLIGVFIKADNPVLPAAYDKWVAEAEYQHHVYPLLLGVGDVIAQSPLSNRVGGSRSGGASTGG